MSPGIFSSVAGLPYQTAPNRETSKLLSSSCFPADAIATLSSEELRRMGALNVEDEVLVYLKRFSARL
jgi:hypothetical protein